uniref:Uncharacterized protein n=1 Tax=Rhizophagus irregularis (strain DAOM 181602 / DAOM 197198 / MUCL 43194) TaxID=747089 RepID=U9TDS4_RHIID
MRLKRFLSYFVNLLRLEIVFNVFWGRNFKFIITHLKILKVRLVSPNIVTNIVIENTNGNLSEISLVYDDYDHDDGIKKIIQTICQNCPNYHTRLDYLSQNWKFY